MTCVSFNSVRLFTHPPKNLKGQGMGWIGKGLKEVVREEWRGMWMKEVEREGMEKNVDERGSEGGMERSVDERGREGRNGEECG